MTTSLTEKLGAIDLDQALGMQYELQLLIINSITPCFNTLLMKSCYCYCLMVLLSLLRILSAGAASPLSHNFLFSSLLLDFFFFWFRIAPACLAPH